jgi:hypothetical protein
VANPILAKSSSVPTATSQNQSRATGLVSSQSVIVTKKVVVKKVVAPGAVKLKTEGMELPLETYWRFYWILKIFLISILEELRLEKAQSMLRKKIAEEMLSTETSYVSNLKVVEVLWDLFVKYLLFLLDMAIPIRSFSHAEFY